MLGHQLVHVPVGEDDRPVGRSAVLDNHLDIPLAEGAGAHIRDFDLAAIETRTIQTDRHCFGCTAGTGSSCAGATSASESPSCPTP